MKQDELLIAMGKIEGVLKQTGEWDKNVADFMSVAKAQLAKSHRTRPDREKIANEYCLWVHHSTLEYLGYDTSKDIHWQCREIQDSFKFADQILARFDEQKAYNRGFEQGKYEEGERILDIVEEYGLDKVSVRDDALERKAKGGQALKDGK